MRYGKEIIAYLAGIIDGEGYIGIKKSLWEMEHRKDIYCPIYKEKIQIKMKDKEPLILFQKIFGGSIRQEKIKDKILFCWSVENLKAIKVLKLVYPFLRIKKKQAQICFKLRKNKESYLARKKGGPRGRLMPKRILNYRERLWQQIKELNQK